MEDNLLREVDDAVRNERLLKLWHDVKRPLLASLIAAVLITAGGSAWREYTRAQNAAFTQKMFDAKNHYDSKAFDKAEAAFTALAKAESGTKAQMALVWQARAERAQNKNDVANATITRALGMKEGVPLWHDLACLELIALTPDIPAECAVRKDSPLAAELRSAHAAALWKQGKLPEAISALDVLIADTATPPLLRDQAEQWKRTIAAQIAALKNPAPAAPKDAK